MIMAEDVDYLVEELRKPFMVLTFALGSMKVERAERWVGAKKRADGARREIVDILNKHGFVQGVD